MNTRRPTMKLVAFGALALALFCACATSISAGSDAPNVQPGGPGLVSTDAGETVQTDAEPEQCVSYECPAPYATCPGVSGVCTTNLSTSFAHCGACDTPCPIIPMAQRRVLNMDFACVQSQCKVICEGSHADCNGIVDDGCETDLDNDPASCGACGTACPAGSICWNGGCGCPSGYTQCGGSCVKLDEDDENCGACGKECTEPDLNAGGGAWPCGAGNYPPGTQFNCAKAQCGMHCAPGLGNCNPDVCGDGCETSLEDDPLNCGACGHACAPGQACASGKCICDPDKTRCGTSCVDLQTDVMNCGACDNACPGQTDFGDQHRGGPVCVLGRCTYSCAPGYADCDHRIDNGCEVDLMIDPLNCGSCGAQCDQRGGQPCAAGRCLTKPCDAGVVH